MGCGLYAGGKEFGKSNTRKNEDGTERCTQAQPLVQNDKCGNPSKNRLQGKDESGVSGGRYCCAQDWILNAAAVARNAAIRIAASRRGVKCIHGCSKRGRLRAMNTVQKAICRTASC